MSNKILSVAILPVILSACGGGSGSSDKSPDPDPTTPTNQAPEVNSVEIKDTNGGDTLIGDQLSGSYVYSDAENDAEGQSLIRWLREGNAIEGATNQDYVLTKDDAGKAITFEVTPLALTGEKQGNSVVSPAINVASQFAPSVKDIKITTVSNGPWVGTEVVGSYTYQDTEGDKEDESLVRWLVDGAEVATSTNRYTLQASDADKSLVFEVTPKAKTGILMGSAVTSSEVRAALQSTPLAKDVAITTANDGPWVGTEVIGSYVYQDNENDLEGNSSLRWLIDGVEVANGTTSYTLQTDDVNKSLVFEVTPIAKTGMLQGASQSSAAIVAKSNSLPEANNVTLSASAQIKVGTQLTGTYTYSDADNDAESASEYRWLRDGAPIANATQTTYILNKEDAGKSISFEVTPAASHGLTPGVPASSTSVLVNALPQLTNFSFYPSEAYSGQQVSVSYSYSDADGDAEGIHKFKWYRDGVLIPDSPTWRYYTLTNEDAGKDITVKVIPMARTGSLEGFEISSEVSLSVDSNLPPEARNVVVTDENGGELNPGDTLTISYDYYDAEGDLEDTGLQPNGTLISWSFRLNNSSGYIPEGRGKTSFVVPFKYAGGQIKANITPGALTGTKRGRDAESDWLNVILPDTTAPVLTQQSFIPSPTFNRIISYTFHSSEAGTIELSGGCVNPSTTNAIQGNNYITFGPLDVGIYNRCSVKVTDEANNVSLPLNITSFEIQRPDPIDLNLLVNDSTTLITSSDESELEVLVSDNKSCSFFEPNQCDQAERLTMPDATTTRLSETEKGYLRVKKGSTETVNQYISNEKFGASISHQVSFYHDRFWLITDYAIGTQLHGIYSSKDGVSWEKVIPNDNITVSDWGHSQVVYQDKLHIMSGRNHVVFDANADAGQQWTTTLIPEEYEIVFAEKNTAYVFDGNLYVLAGYETTGYKNTQLFGYNGVGWKKLSDEVTIENESTLIGGGDFEVVQADGELLMFALLGDSRQPHVLRSNNGINWHKVNVTGDALPTTAIDIEAVKLGNTFVTAFYMNTGLYGEQIIYHSSDGENWNKVYEGQVLRYKEGQEWITVDNQLYAFGGGNLWLEVVTNDAWVSNDGIDFQTLSPVAKAPSLYHHRVLAFNGYLWGFSVLDETDKGVLQVMRTKDGVRWKEMHVSNKGVVSADLEVEVYTWNDKMYVINGFGVDTIYSSHDGLNWIHEGNLPFNTGYRIAPEVMNNGDHSIMVGGIDGARSYRSSDGINWTEQTTSDNGLPAELARHQLVKTDNGRLMSIGGAPKIPLSTGGWLTYPVDHVYTSDDNGISWQHNEALKLPFIMADHQAINYKGKVWLYSKDRVYQLDEAASEWIERGTTPNHSDARDHQVVEYQGRLWMLGGNKDSKQLYVSDDAVNWYLMKPVTLEFP